MKIYAEDNNYRVVDGYGPYMNKRYEIQEKYSYCENDELVQSWHMIFYAPELNLCLETYEKNYKGKPIKKYSLPFIDWMEE